MAQDADIDLMLADGEDTATIGGVTVACQLWTQDQIQAKDANSGGHSLGMSYILLRASLFPDLAQGDPITVNGVQYRAGLVSRVQDGKILHVWLGVPNG
jgi:hypothetical protein